MMRSALYSVYALAVLAAVGCKDSNSPVVNIPTVKTVTVTPATANVTVGLTTTLSVTMVDSVGVAVSGATATWSTTNAAVATVAAGVVTGVSAGTALIIATSNTHSDTATITVSVAAPVRFTNVFVVGLLQKDYATFTAANMPFLDSISKLGGKSTNYFGNTTPSIGNFFMLAAGDTLTNNDTSSIVQTGDNLVRQLVLAGKTWKSYAENIPSAGYIGPDNGLYVRRHNVFTLISDVTTSPTRNQNLVPITQLQTDITANALPNFGMIVPNECNNSNTSNTVPACSITNADSWLRTTLTPLLNSAPFQAGGNGLLIVLFDRSSTSTVNGGGKVAWVVFGPRAKVNFSSATLYQHQSTLRLVMESLGVTAFPGRAATAPSMAEFLTTP